MQKMVFFASKMQKNNWLMHIFFYFAFLKQKTAFFASLRAFCPILRFVSSLRVVEVLLI